MHKMNLHDIIEEKWYRITRVPGGWLYASKMYASKDMSCFVPYSKEFDPLVKKCFPSGHHTEKFKLSMADTQVIKLAAGGRKL